MRLARGIARRFALALMLVCTAALRPRTSSRPWTNGKSRNEQDGRGRSSVVADAMMRRTAVAGQREAPGRNQDAQGPRGRLAGRV